MKRILFIFFVFFELLFGQDLNLLSQNDNSNLSQETLDYMYENGDLAYLLYYKPKNDNNGSKQFKDINMSNFAKNDMHKNKIAVLIPQFVIGNYANVVKNSILAYIASQNIDVDVKFYFSKDESDLNLQKEFSKIKSENISFVIAPFTAKGIKYIVDNTDLNTLFFIPTLHKDLVEKSTDNIIFGGIDYKKQIKKLLEKSNDKLYIVTDTSRLAKNLDMYVAQINGHVAGIYTLASARATLFEVLNDSHKNGSFFLNIPLKQVFVVTSELRASQINPHAILTTQINYTPDIFSTIQYGDRKKLYIANSISNTPQYISDAAFILGIDMKYDWVAYSTMIGIDYLYSNFINLNHSRVFKENIENSQVIYEVNIFMTDENKFKQIR